MMVPETYFAQVFSELLNGSSVEIVGYGGAYYSRCLHRIKDLGVEL